MMDHAFDRRSVLRGLGALFAWPYVPRLAHCRRPRSALSHGDLRGGLDGLALSPRSETRPTSPFANLSA